MGSPIASIIRLFLLALSKAVLQDQTIKDEIRNWNNNSHERHIYSPKKTSLPLSSLPPKKIQIPMYLCITHLTKIYYYRSMRNVKTESVFCKASPFSSTEIFQYALSKKEISNIVITGITYRIPGTIKRKAIITSKFQRNEWVVLQDGQ